MKAFLRTAVFVIYILSYTSVSIRHVRLDGLLGNTQKRSDFPMLQIALLDKAKHLTTLFRQGIDGLLDKIEIFLLKQLFFGIVGHWDCFNLIKFEVLVI